MIRVSTSLSGLPVARRFAAFVLSTAAPRRGLRLVAIALLALVWLTVGPRPAAAVVFDQTEIVDSAGFVGAYSSLALDATGRPRISYWDQTNGDLKYAAWNGASWDLATVDSAGNVGPYTSLALDAAGQPRISYYDDTNDDLKYAAWNGASWDLATVDSAGFVGGYTSLALDAAGRPRISYYDGSNGDLKYAAWNGSSWDITTVDSTGVVGYDTSLALDAAGRPRISYWNYTNGHLKYAAWNGSSWDIATVDSAGFVGYHTSLALDAAGRPRISHSDLTNFDLKYAAWNGSSWDLATVDSAGFVGQYTSLALDAAGQPRISYHDDTNDDLKYAAWNGASWDLATVDSAGVVGTYTSLALDGCDNPHISYFDNSNGDLKYTTAGECNELTVVKAVNGGPGGWSFDFTGDLDPFTLTEADPDTVFAGLDAGSYTFSETANAAYDTAIACDNGDSSANGTITVTIDDGDKVICTVTNTYDATAPAVTINQAAGQTDPTSTSPINFTVVFSEPVTGFETGDVTLGGTAGATTATVSGGPTTYTVTVSGMTGDGTVTATVPANVAEDAAGNDNAASTSTDNQVTYDAPGAIYLTAAGGSVPGAGAYQKNDILQWDGSAWSVWFDGDSAGMVRTSDIMAFDVDDPDAGSAWITIRQAQKLPGLGKMQPQQIAYYNGTSWSLFFDGADVGLKVSGEAINGLEVLPGSASPIGNGCLTYLLISTIAGGGVPVGPTNVNFTGEDVLGFCMTQSGPNTAGQWHIVFEGESQGLQKNNNLGLSATADAATLYLTVKKSFTGDGGLVKPSELFSFSNGVFSGPLWQAKAHGLMQVVDGIDVIGAIP